MSGCRQQIAGKAVKSADLRPLHRALPDSSTKPNKPKQNSHHHTSTRPQSHHKTHKHRPTKRQQQTAITRAAATKGKARCKRAQENYTSRQGTCLSGCNTAGNLETTSLWHSDQAKINALLTPISGNILQYCSI